MIIKSEMNISIVEVSDLVEIFFEKLREKKEFKIKQSFNSMVGELTGRWR